MLAWRGRLAEDTGWQPALPGAGPAPVAGPRARADRRLAKAPAAGVPWPTAQGSALTDSVAGADLGDIPAHEEVVVLPWRLLESYPKERR
jgi:hypothetical protein